MDILHEIFSSLKQNKLRTILTGLSVSWGIFILIILLAAGNGLRNGVTSNFSDRSTNIMQMWSGRSSMPYKGLKSNRSLDFSEKQMTAIAENIPEAGPQTAIVSKQQTITYKNETGDYRIRGVSPEYTNIYKLEFQNGNGRFINDLDMKMNNKVIVIDRQMEESLFKGESALGKYLQVGAVMFRVVGINTKKARWGGASAYIPFSTAQIIYNPNKKFYQLAFTLQGLESETANEQLDERLRNTMAQSLTFDPKDPQAVWIQNSQRDYIETMRIFGGINIFVTIIGILTLIAGIVGVSNIMLVSVKERTREFGIRKAIGAPPASILRSIVLESILITTIFGYIGMMVGLTITEIIGFVMEQSADSSGMSIFKDPTVDLGYVFFATAILILAGIIAGYMPARRAVRIKPIEAMREE